jgi:hypothetical protein
MFNLNLVGSRILELLETGSSEEQVAAVVSREFNADMETVKRDLAEFLDVLKTHNLVHTPGGDEESEEEGDQLERK